LTRGHLILKVLLRLKYYVNVFGKVIRSFVITWQGKSGTWQHPWEMTDKKRKKNEQKEIKMALAGSPVYIQKPVTAVTCRE